MFSRLVLSISLITSMALGSSTRIQQGDSLITSDATKTWASYDSGTTTTTIASPLRLSGSTSGYTGLQSPAVGSNVTYTLPTADGSSGQVLSTDGSGGLSWATASGGGGSGVGFQTVGGLLFSNFLKTQNGILNSAATDIAYSSSLHLYALSQSGTSSTEITTSPDGVNWTNRTITGPLNAVTWSPGLGMFITVGNNGKIFTSTNGTSWTSRTDPNGGGTYYAVYCNSAPLCVAVGNAYIIYSSNGTTWNAASNPGNDWRGVTYGGSTWVVVGQTSGAGNQVLTSPDGQTWTSRTAATSAQWKSVAYGNGLFAAVNINDSTNQVMTSPDGATWTSRATGSVGNAWQKIAYYDDIKMFAVAGQNLMNSYDGTTWTIKNPSAISQAVRTFVWDPDRGVFMGANSTDIMQSNMIGEGFGSGAGGNPVTSLTTVGSSPNANAATISGNTLRLQPFDSTNPGVVPASGGGTSNFLRADGTWASAGSSFSGIRVYLNSTISGYSNGGRINFDTVEYSSGSDVSYSTGTHAITFSTAGKYNLCATVRENGMTGTVSGFEESQLQLVNLSGTTGNPSFGNSAPVTGVIGTNSPNFATLSGCVLINASAGATAVIVSNTPASASNVNIADGINTTYFSIVKQ